VAAAVIIGSLLTFLVLRSIVVPLRRLTEAMAGLNAGDVDVPIPEAGRDEIGAVAQTLALFRDTLKELRETLAQLEALRAVGRAVGSTLDLERVLSTVVARAVEFAHAQAGMIYEFDDAAREFRFRSSHGAEPELTEELRAAPIRHGEGAISAAAITGSPAQVRDLLTERQITLPKFVEALARRGYRSLIAAPLLHEEDVLGGLVIARREAGEFSKQVVSLIEAFATQSALAVRNAKLFDEQRRRERDLRVAHEQLKQAQANLIHAEKMASLGQLTAGIAHEIKNPLNFVNNFAELSRELLQELRDTIASPGADQDELIATLTANLAKIVEHGRRADGIVTSMLSHSRGGTGERRTIDLNALVEEALNLAFHGARARDKSFNITLERDLDAELRPIELVPQDITRVLLNLFGNGFYAANKRLHEATDPAFQPSLRVTTRDLGDQVEIKVRDNGVGMPPEVQSKLFTPFFTTKPTGEGTGLGLSISYDIVVQQHGGTITVDSRPGEFTEFTVRLPRTLQAAERATATGASA
jgi:signal transduction histidine kinase/HAMP domain-containing protein